MEMAVIFDMDGVIVDNGKYHVLAYAELCRRYNLEFSEAEFMTNQFGKVNEEVLPELFGRELSVEEIEKYAGEKESAYRKIYGPEMTAMPGLVDLLKELKKQHIPVGVATSAPEGNVEFVTEGLGISGYLDAIVDDSMVTRGKPHPEIYLKAAEILKTAPANCLVFEDSLSGTRAAYEAGMRVVAVTTTLKAEEHKYAHDTIPDFRDMTVHKIRKMMSGKIKNG